MEELGSDVVEDLSAVLSWHPVALSSVSSACLFPVGPKWLEGVWLHERGAVSFADAGLKEAGSAAGIEGVR